MKNPKKQLERNLTGLLTKCYKYGDLRGVELGIFILYPDRKRSVTYETEGFSLNKLAELVCGTLPVQ